MNVSSGEDELLPVSRKRRLTNKEDAAPESRSVKAKNESDTQSPTSKRRRVNTVVEASSDTETEAPSATSKPRSSLVNFASPPPPIVEEQSALPYEDIRKLRVDRIYGCRLTSPDSDNGSSDAVVNAMYLVKWENRSYRELCWVNYEDLIEEHDAEAKIMKFHRKNEAAYLAAVADVPDMDDIPGDKQATILTKSRHFSDSGGWRVPRANIYPSASEQGNFLLFSKVDRIIGFRLQRHRVKASIKALKQYLVKWNLQGYEFATWESELVLCGRGTYAALYGLHLNERLANNYDFYFSEEKLKAMQELELRAIQTYERSNRLSMPLGGLKSSASGQGVASRLEGFEYKTSATTDTQGTTVLWQIFLEEKLGDNGLYKPSMTADGNCRTLLAHQQEGLKWLFYNAEKTGHGSLLADEMGLGKTCQSVVYLQHLLDVSQRKHGSPASHALVVLQKSTLENWKREFSIWAPNLNVVAFCGSKSDRNAVLEWEVNYHNLKDGSDRRDVADPLRADVILVTYESIRSPEFRRLLPSKYKWTSVVVDECQKAKGGYSSVLRSCLERLPRENIVLLSGTPVQNSVKELFPLLSLLHPSRFSYDEAQASRVEYTETSFLMTFGDIQNRDDCVELTEKLQALLRPYILRREKSQVLKALPPKLVKLIKVPLTMIQKKVYQAIYRRTAKLRVSGIQMQLRKVCIHPFMVEGVEEMILAGKFGPLKYRPRSPNLLSSHLVETRGVGAELTPTTHPGSEQASVSQSPTSPIPVDPSDVARSNPMSTVPDPVTAKSSANPKSSGGNEVVLTEAAERELQVLLQCSGKFILIDKMLRAYRKRGQKVLLFSFFKTALDLIQYYAELMDWIIERIDGDTTGEARQICIDRFNTDPDRFLFLCTTRAGGLGVNLTSASVVIHLDSDYNPQHDLQAQARCHRIGQNRNVEVYHLVAEDTYENYILFDIAGRKLGLEQVLLGRLQSATGATAVQKKKLSKHQEEVALKKGVYAALRDDAKTAEEEEAFTNLSIEHILAQKTEIVSEDQSAESDSEKLPSAFSTARFEESLDDDLDRGSFWEEVQSQLDRISDGDMLDEVWEGGSKGSGNGLTTHREGRRRRFTANSKEGVGGHESASDSSETETEKEEIDNPDDDDVDFHLSQNSSKATQSTQSTSPDSRATPPAGSSEAPVKPARRITGTRGNRRETQPPVSSQSSDTATQEDGTVAPNGGRTSIARKRRSRSTPEGTATSTASHIVSKVDKNALGAAIRLTATILQPPPEAVTRVCERLTEMNLPHLCQVWRENVEKKEASSPLSATENLPHHALVYDLVYRCLCGIEAWTKTPFGAANGIKSEHLRWIDQFSPWGILAMHEATLRVLDASCNPDLDAAELKGYDISQVTQTFLKEFLGALTSWEASCRAWEEGKMKFQDLLSQEYRRRAEEMPTLMDGAKPWYDHGSITDEMVLSIIGPLVNEIFGDQIGHREGGSRRQTWIPAEDVVAKFLFLHLAIGLDLQPLTHWPPPGDEVDWSLVSQVVGKVSRLADGPERRRDAVLNRYYNRLDSRWNEEPFTEEERSRLVAGYHSKAQPATIARQLNQRNLEKVKKGLRCIQLQIAAGEKKRKSAPEFVQSSPSRESMLPPGLEDVPVAAPSPAAVVLSSAAPVSIEEVALAHGIQDDAQRSLGDLQPGSTGMVGPDHSIDVLHMTKALLAPPETELNEKVTGTSSIDPKTSLVESSACVTAAADLSLTHAPRATSINVE